MSSLSLWMTQPRSLSRLAPGPWSMVGWDGASVSLSLHPHAHSSFTAGYSSSKSSLGPGWRGFTNPYWERKWVELFGNLLSSEVLIHFLLFYLIRPNLPEFFSAFGMFRPMLWRTPKSVWCPPSLSTAAGPLVAIPDNLCVNKGTWQLHSLKAYKARLQDPTSNFWLICISNKFPRWYWSCWSENRIFRTSY